MRRSLTLSNIPWIDFCSGLRQWSNKKSSDKMNKKSLEWYFDQNLSKRNLESTRRTSTSFY